MALNHSNSSNLEQLALKGLTHYKILSTSRVPFRSFFMSRISGAVGPELSFPRPSPSFHPIFCSNSRPRCTADSVVCDSVTDVATVDDGNDTVVTDVTSDADDALGSVSEELATTCCYERQTTTTPGNSVINIA